VAAILAATVVCTVPAHGQAGLMFLGFRPGAARAEVEAAVRANHGRWACDRSKQDGRFFECRGRIAPPGEPVLAVTGSLINDTLAILLVSGTVSDADLQRWEAGLAAVVGPPSLKRANGQLTWQWVKRRKMIRITTRVEGTTRVASVSLVDGIVLDNLDRPAGR
jgi:hypothetical protein